MKNLFDYQIRPYLKLLGLILTYPIWIFFEPHKRRRFLRFSRLCWNDLPVISLNEIIPDDMSDDVSVTLKALPTKDHNCSIVELFILGICSRIVEAKSAYEIGTYDGRSTLAIAINADKKGKTHTLNLPEDYFDGNPDQQHRIDIQLSKKVKSGFRFLRQPEKDSIVQHWGVL